ncbi:MAG TPA: leucine--tRNA ligase [Tepidisphaeraceae bacterium]|nr:leucine--tRNA ligase [Tepidisphaeraceae bacterium]
MPYNFTAVEKKWQQYWLANKSFRALDPAEAGGAPKSYVLDMFPYPSGEGLHVGHCEQQTATDILCRYLRMKGHNVLHPIGWDAFGLPAEQYAIKTNTHPRVTTERNIANFRRQIQSLGFGYDWDREVNTTDPNYYKWTQWIFLQLFNSYFDPIQERAMPIGHLINELQNENYVIAPDGSIHINPVQEGLDPITGDLRVERIWTELAPEEGREIIDGQRLAYQAEVPVNWCPGLGTVLSNEEVIDGKSEVGGFPVERRPMRQWMLRITAYADRLVNDLDLLQWPDSLKEMQRNWIGKSVGADVDFEVVPPGDDVKRVEANRRDTGDTTEPDEELTITVFTTRPDTLYGATYMVLAPEHPLVDRITPTSHRETIESYRTMIAGKSDRDRMAETKDKSGVFTGAHAINPVNDQKLPIYIADYVLMGYGTGAIMAVPAHDERDFDFAKKFNLPIRQVVRPSGMAVSAMQGPTEEVEAAFVGEGIAINSDVINDLPTAEAKERIISILEREGTGRRSVKYKLRDWLFSRQRYWGEPFPIVLDEAGNAYDIPESELPLKLPEIDDFKPTGTPEPPLSKAREWLRYERDGKVFTRETNTMPQWAGSCWYYLRYIDPHNDQRFVDPEKEQYWMPVDLYVGGVEHAVLHLLYARFWHKVLFDLGHVSTLEPFMRLVNQGLILGEMEYHTVEDPPRKVSEDEVEKRGENYVLKSDPTVKVKAESFKMSKSRGNVVNPDDIVRDYGADTFRLYEMYMGPLEAQKPWNTRDIVGMARFLNGVWRNLVGDEETNKVAKIEPIAIPETIDRQMHRTIKKVEEDIAGLRFNTAIAELIKLNNEMTKLAVISRELAENFTLMLAPFAPHIAEELWERLGHTKSLARRPWPTHEPAKLLETTLELPVQVNGKLRDKIAVPADADEETILTTAAAAPGAKPWIEGKTMRKRLYVPKKLVNFVVG